ncbi:MAG: hypothetical protein J0L72_10020 [Armatimonadetes bacterium]|nr:hypothetical protein [Armatimonadota bacterium]
MIKSLMCAAVLSAPNKSIYPLAKPKPCPNVVLDCRDFPQGEAWGKDAVKLISDWYDSVTSWLATDGVDPFDAAISTTRYAIPKTILVVIKKKIDPPAYASGGTITINGEWITAHPEDLGMVIHELTHVIQAYPANKADTGWLVEGIADYTRWWRYEPELHATKGRTVVDFSKANYTDAYRTTAVWLAWASRKHHMALVPALDAALRRGDDPAPIFVKVTGKSAAELWAEFKQDSGS